MTRSRPHTFEDALARRQTIRKSGDAPPPLPPAVAEAEAAFIAELTARLLVADDPMAVVGDVVRKAVGPLLRQAIADLEAERPAVRKSAPTPPMDPTTTTFVTKGGTAWAQIEAGAATLAGATVATMTKAALAKAVDEFLKTSAGAQLYSQYLVEADQAVATEARRRRNSGR